MMRQWITWCGVCWCLVSTCFSQSVGETSTPSWIWQTESDHASSDDRLPELSFETTFELSSHVTRATLRYAAQYTSGTILLNQRVLAEVEAYGSLLEIDVTDHLRSGSHELSVHCQPVPGPSGFFLVLDIKLDDGSELTVATDESWQPRERVVVLENVSRQWLIPANQRVGISAIENYEQWKQAIGNPDIADPSSFQVAEGFQIRLVRLAQPDEDSWVGLTFDPHGRVIIAKEQAGLLRMTLDTSGHSVIKTESINETLEECRGLVWSGKTLFANANRSKALYSMNLLADDSLSKPQVVFASSGGTGHGRNELCLAGDGMLYSIHGDSVDLPPIDVPDMTSPFREARRGEKTSEGHLLRIDPTSGQRELLTAGLRNPFGIDFNADGECFTYDADAEYDMGAPWYRPTRVNHLVVGGDYGWRGVTKSWPPYYCDRADNAPWNLDIGKGSPTAVMFGTRSHFPPRYQQGLFVLDWAYGRVLMVNMAPRGASYLMTAETFLQGRPLNVTDIDFDDSGAMYLVTGGRKTQSALYRVDYVGERHASAPEPSDYQQACQRFAEQARLRRRALEAQLTRKPNQDRLSLAWASLNDPDPWIQYAAVNLLERQPVNQWSELALGDHSPRTSVRALLSLARSGATAWDERILRKLNSLPFAELPLSQQLAILQTYQLILSRDHQVSAHTITATGERLGAFYPSETFPVNRLLSDMLVRMNLPSVTATTMQLLRSAGDPVQQMQYLFVLRNTSQGWTIDDRRSYFEILRAANDFLGGAGTPDFLGKIREEATATLSAIEQEQLHDLFSETVQPAAVELPPRPFVRNWTVDDLLDAISPAREPDLERGKELFVAASCSRCHRVGGWGTLVGPDLTAASGRYTRRDLVAAIIEPSSVIAENYRSVQVVTHDGQSYTGQIAVGGDYRSPLLRLATDPLRPFDVVEIEKSTIAMQKYSDVSWMPTELLNTLTSDEAHDLIAFIESGGQLDQTAGYSRKEPR